MSTGKIELSVGAVKIANKYEIFDKKEIDAINNKIPELDERVGVVEDEIEEINSSLDNNTKNDKYINFINFYVDNFTIALRDALLYAETNNKIVFIPNGSYDIGYIEVNNFFVEGMENTILNITEGIKINKSIKCESIIFNGLSENVNILDLSSENERDININKCSFKNGSYGIYTKYSIFNINELSIKNCTFENLKQCGIRLDKTVIEKGEVISNTFKNIGNSSSQRAIGVILGNIATDGNVYSKNIVISNNYIENIVAMDSTGNDSCQAVGILLYGKDSIIENNTVKNILGKGSDHEGIYVKGSNCLIKNNHIENGGQGDGYITSKYYNDGFSPNRIIGNKCVGTDGGKAIYGVNICEISDNIVDIKENINYTSSHTIYISNNYTDLEIKNNKIKCTYISDIERFVINIDSNNKIPKVNIQGNNIESKKSSFIKMYCNEKTMLIIKENNCIFNSNNPNLINTVNEHADFIFINNNIKLNDESLTTTSSFFNLSATKNIISNNSFNGVVGRFITSFKGELQCNNNHIDVDFSSGLYIRNGVEKVVFNNNNVNSKNTIFYFYSYTDDGLDLTINGNYISSTLGTGNIFTTNNSSFTFSKLKLLNNTSNIDFFKSGTTLDEYVNINNNKI